MSRVSYFEDIEDARQAALVLQEKIEIGAINVPEADRRIRRLPSRCKFVVGVMEEAKKLKTDLGRSTLNKLYQLKLERQEALEKVATLERQIADRNRRALDSLNKKVADAAKRKKAVQSNTRKPKRRKRPRKYYFRTTRI